jgi:hypothetical protein
MDFAGIAAGKSPCCDDSLLAFFSVIQALRHLTFDLRVHPERLERIVLGIETAIAPFSRGAA